MSRKKVAFYLETKLIEQTDCSKIMEGNPGIGGTEYEFLLVSFLLEQRENGIDAILIISNILAVPHKNTVVIAGGVEAVCEYCTLHEVELLVINHLLFQSCVFNKYQNLSLVLWAHLRLGYDALNRWVETPYIKRIVCCGKEMLDLFRDHPVTAKSTFVYNIFPIHEKAWYLDRMDKADNHNVVFMGMLSKIKGFQFLARVWKKVVDEVPDAQLYVLGGGNLYDKNAKLGKYGIASVDFEEEIIPWLVDGKGNLLSSVHFMGVMGEEKFEVLGKCKVGVPNPSGVSEALPITAIEMQLMGCNLTTIKHPAYLDTICNQDYLYSDLGHLKDYLVKRLLSGRDDYSATYQFITRKFGLESSIRRWENIIWDIDKPLCIEPCSSNGYHAKRLKNFLLSLKLKYAIFNFIPPVERFYDFYAEKICKVRYR